MMVIAVNSFCEKIEWQKSVNSLSANLTKWSDTLKQFADELFVCVYPFCSVGA